MIGNRCIVTLLLSAALMPTTVQGQSLFDQYRQQKQKQFDDYKARKQKEFDEYRRRKNEEFAEYMRQRWPEFEEEAPIEKPKEDKDVPPVVLPKEDRDKPIETKPVPIEEVVAPPPAPKPQPEPVAPIEEKPQPQVQYVQFTFYGTPCKVRFSDKERFRLSGCTNEAVAEAWKRLSGEAYDNMLYDCLELRKTLRLSDWAYLNMLSVFSETCLGKTNEARVLMGFIYCQSGYKMRFGITGDRLCVLYASDHIIFDRTYFDVDNEKFYVFGEGARQLAICDVSFPKEQSLSLWINRSQLFGYTGSSKRVLQSERYPDMRVEVSMNKNLIDFYNSYPVSIVGDNFMTKWAMYANAEVDKWVETELYPQLEQKIKGLSELEAAERLLNWVQTAFVYEYDDKVWGYDRAFFAEETLYYPYCDCEDRSILFSHLMRDLLDLDVVLVYYPGHLATAVCFSEDVAGDYLWVDNLRFVVCDPTFINATVGMTMTGMDNKGAKAILLKN